MKKYQHFICLLMACCLSLSAHSQESSTAPSENLNTIQTIYDSLQSNEEKREFVKKLLDQERDKPSSQLARTKQTINDLTFKTMMHEEGSKIALAFELNRNSPPTQNDLAIAMSLACVDKKYFWLNSIGLPIAVAVANKIGDKNVSWGVIRPGDCGH